MRKDIFSIAVLFVVNIWYFWPIIKNPTNRIVNDYDGVFTAWVLKSMGDKIITGEKPFWDGKIFYPHQNTLAFSDPYLTDTILALPLILSTDEPIALFNTALIIGQGLTLILMFFLLHELTNNRIVAVIGSLALGFSLLRLQYAGHLHTMNIQWVILGWLALTKLTLKPTKAWLMVFWVALILQTINAFLPGYWLVFSFGAFLTVKQFRENLWNLRRLVILGGVLTLLSLIPIIKPYLTIQKTYHYVRPITDAINFSLSPEEVATKYFSPGLYVFIAVGMGIYLIRKRPRHGGAPTYIWISFVSFIMALGPALHWMGKTVKIWTLHIPLPYLLAYYLLPGFGGFRTPSRWIVPAAMAAVAAAAIAISRIKLPWRNYGLAGVLCLTFITLPPFKPVPVPTEAQYPPEYFALKNLPPGPVLELPIFRWGSDDFAKNEAWRMLYQTYHQHPLVNGYAGFSPPDWERQVSEWQQAATISAQPQIDYVLIHETEYRKWGREIPDLPGFKAYGSYDQTALYYRQ